MYCIKRNYQHKILSDRAESRNATAPKIYRAPKKGKYAVVLSVIIAYFFKKSRRSFASDSENSRIRLL